MALSYKYEERFWESRQDFYNVPAMGAHFQVKTKGMSSRLFSINSRTGYVERVVMKFS